MSETSTATPLLEVRHVSLAYDGHRVVHDVSFAVLPGRMVCLLGPSGCGKTTMLRAIAGFEPVEQGEIMLAGRSASRPGWTLPPEKRGIGMVFQDYGLFPHLNVADNVTFGLRGVSRDERERRLTELLETMGLMAARRRLPHELSGGQQQRVALARALAPRPALILMDEPFSSLDVELRERLSQELRELLQRHNVTAVMVTHHQNEAFAMADEIGVMSDGHIRQWDNAYNLYPRPASRFVADFIGEGALLPGAVLGDGRVEIETGVITTGHAPACRVGRIVDVLLRPDDVVHDDGSDLKAEVTHKAFRGAEILYTLRLARGGRVLALVASHHNHAIGEKIGIRILPDDIVCFPRESGAEA